MKLTKTLAIVLPYHDYPSAKKLTGLVRTGWEVKEAITAEVGGVLRTLLRVDIAEGTDETRMREVIKKEFNIQKSALEGLAIHAATLAVEICGNGNSSLGSTHYYSTGYRELHPEPKPVTLPKVAKTR